MTETKRKYFTAIVLCLVMLALTLSCLYCFASNNVANAQTTECEEPEAETRGISTSISVTLGVKDGSVCAVARNDFTLGISTIQVYVELFSSTTYSENVNDMRLICYNYTADLNIYKSIETSAPIAGEQKYWRARVRYKMDNQSWVSKETRTALIGADGSTLN
ncbi:MAG: hypothetical protein K2O95_06925 [Clostridia bacterium]|nr:hypothetical protein [Clostridia bacterium]